jgi:hypothetical protein
MKLTVQQIYDATETLAAIIRERRPMPQRGKFLLARMHAKLLPEYNIANEHRVDLIKSYGFHPKEKLENGIEIDSEGFAVPEGKLAEFRESWGKIASESIEVDIEPIALTALDLGAMANGSIEANEMIVLGELIKD